MASAIAATENIWFVCVGTDRSTGDALGPLVGSKLKALGYENVVGTVEHPCHAVNLEECIADIPADALVIGIDAALGQASSIGKILFENAPLMPGAGVNKALPPIGTYRIVGIVNVGGFMEYFVLQNTRLHVVFKMVDEIVDMIQRRFPLNASEKCSAPLSV